MKTHPQVPLICVTTSSGKCYFFTVSSKKLRLLKVMHLLRHSIDKMQFSKKGSTIGFASVQSTDLFLLETVTTKAVDVVFHCTSNKPIIDLIIYENEDSFHILILTNAFCNSAFGDCIEICAVDEQNVGLEVKCRIDMGGNYQQLKYAWDESNKFLAMTLNKQIQVFQVGSNFDSVDLISSYSSDHKLRKHDIFTLENYTLTSALDGFIVLRENLDSLKKLEMFKVHHHMDGGTKQAVVLPHCRIIVALGNNGSIVGLQFG